MNFQKYLKIDNFHIADNADEILQNILKVREKGKKNFSNNCRDYAKNNFAKEDRVKDYYNLYKAISKPKEK